MTRLPVGMILLLIVFALIFLGLAQRALDRMKLSDKGAMAVIAGLIVGSFITIPVVGGRLPITVNLGGALIPLGLAVYLIATAGTAREKIRSIIGAFVTALAIYAVGTLLMRGLPEPAGRYGFIDALWLFPLVAGIVGYLAGRSRRGAFISATLGVIFFDLGHYIWLVSGGAPAGRADIGGAGAFDAVVISGVLAVLLAETVGEIRERMAGGPTVKDRDPSLAGALKKPGLDREDGDNREVEDTEGGGRGKGMRDLLGKRSEAKDGGMTDE